MSYSKSSKRENELLKIQQEREGMSCSKSSNRERERVTQNPVTGTGGVARTSRAVHEYETERARERKWMEDCWF